MTPTTRTCAIALLACLVGLAGCTDKTSERASSTGAPPQLPVPAAAPEATPTPEQQPPARPVPAPGEAVPQSAKEPPATLPLAVAPGVKPEPARPEASKPAPPITSQKPAAARPNQVISKDVVVLKGSPLGGVRFEHKLHVTRAANACETCHHASKPEKPATAPQQACSECHTKVPASPMKTKYQAAFHNPMAQSGTCIDCHKAQNATGKKAPVKCAECHKKENA